MDTNIWEKVLNPNGSIDLLHQRLVILCTTLFLKFFFHFYMFNVENLTRHMYHGMFVLFVM